jgi:phosphoesterase RecJ-like protein
MDVAQKIQQANRIWLSTHKSADGDGLGSEMAFYHAMNSISKEVHIVHNDPSAARYAFLTEKTHDASEHFEFEVSDLALILDTHDPALCSPFFEKLQAHKVSVIFIDHHVPVKKNIPFVSYFIQENASCTGEIVFELIKKLQIEITPKIATALYASLLFDTQNFKYIRSSSKPFEMATELIRAGADHLLIQKNIFDNWSVNKMNYLSLLIQNVDYRNEQKMALIKISRKSLEDFKLSSDDVTDFVDLFMSIQSLEVAIVIREENFNDYKLSFRSRTHEVLTWAQSFSGGGHLYSSGAWVSDTEKNILARIDSLIQKQNKLIS